jgi:hypothetical protein
MPFEILQHLQQLVSAHHNHSRRVGYPGGFLPHLPRSHLDVTSIKPCETRRLEAPLEAA